MVPGFLLCSKGWGYGTGTVRRTLSNDQPFETGRAGVVSRSLVDVNHCEYGTVWQTSWKRRGVSGLGEVTAGCRLPPLAGG